MTTTGVWLHAPASSHGPAGSQAEDVEMVGWMLGMGWRDWAFRTRYVACEVGGGFGDGGEVVWSKGVWSKETGACAP